ncbi:hypothetical protein [Anaerotignum sp.]|uniref:hypothetical protein n=1 Tax=Anaerotignum sp. TaxID=2039241 RepID=UPI0028A95DA4|nr:hypothetical protein [Anaerotignum sp.]
MNIKNVFHIDEESIAELFSNLEQCLACMEDEPAAVMTEDETFVIMTAEDFHYLQIQMANKQSQAHIATFLEMLEGLSIEELEHILTLANSQLTIKMARKYFVREEQL